MSLTDMFLNAFDIKELKRESDDLKLEGQGIDQRACVLTLVKKNSVGVSGRSSARVSLCGVFNASTTLASVSLM